MADENAEKNAIREVMAKYCFRLDGGDFDGMAALFTPNGVWETAYGPATGRAAIAAKARAIRTSDKPVPRSLHHCTNIVIELDGDGANVMSNWLVVANSENGPKVASSGTYTDRMAKHDGSWHFVKRKIDWIVAPGRS